jgi:hypothetical protein
MFVDGSAGLGESGEAGAADNALVEAACGHFAPMRRLPTGQAPSCQEDATTRVPLREENRTSA